MIEKLIKIWVKEKVYLSICFLLLFLLAGTWSLSDSTFVFLKSMPQITTPLLCKVLLSLLLISLALVSALCILLRKPNVKNYEHINPPGFYKHKKTGGYYCQPCLDQRHIASPLSTISEKEFRCRACNETYEIDYSVLICDAYLSMVHDRAASELIPEKETCNK